MWLDDAWQTLDSARGWDGMSGMPNPIRLEAIEAYCRLFGVPEGDERALVVLTIQVVDRDLLGRRAAKLKAERQPKTSPTASRPATLRR